MALKASQGKSSRTKKNSQYINKAARRYCRLAGLTLLQLIVVSLPGYYIMLAVQSVLREADIGVERDMNLGGAKQDIQFMNRFQENYYQKNNIFSNSITDITELHSEISTQTETHNYSTQANAWAAFNYGLSRRDDLKSYVGGVFVPVDQNQSQLSRDSGLASILCEANSPGRTKLNEPFYNNGVLTCPPGTTKMSSDKN